MGTVNLNSQFHLLQIHGGTTEYDIVSKVQEAEDAAVENTKICARFALKRKDGKVCTLQKSISLFSGKPTISILEPSN